MKESEESILKCPYLCLKILRGFNEPVAILAIYNIRINLWSRSQNCGKLILASSRLSVRLTPSAWNNPAPTGRIFMKFCVCVFFEDLSRKSKFHYNLTRIKGILHEKQLAFFIISRSILLKMRRASDKMCRENKIYNLHSFFFFFFSENRAVS